MANKIVIEPRFQLGDEVCFIGNGHITSGDVVAINYCDYNGNATIKYKDEKIRGVSYGVKVCINYFGSQYEVVDVSEEEVYASKIELAQHLLNQAKQ